MAYVPHPPVIVPEVGRGREREALSTVEAMRALSDLLFGISPAKVLLLSTPHHVMRRDRLEVISGDSLEGDLSDFWAPQVKVKLRGDGELASSLARKLREAGLPVGLSLAKTIPLDHGSVVPLSYLLSPYSRSDLPRALILSPGFCPLNAILEAGKVAFDLLDSLEEPVGMVISGDLSHRLTPDAPAGFNPRAKEFDEAFVEALSSLDPRPLLELDPSFVEMAGECGLRPSMILFGAASVKPFRSRILSYEGPFGVGYCVAAVEPAVL